MSVSSANYVFLPWVRQGAAAGIQTIDGLTHNQPGIVSLPVRLRVNTADIERQVRLHGPGDVTGIDPQQVVRTEPRHLATEFEPNYFPAIEFDRPDFPWLFTPAKANTTGKLRPWLCLAVVRKQDGVTLAVDRNLPLPVLEIKAPAQPRNELPDLAESWAWAHTQVTGSQPSVDSLRQSLAGDPALTVSRLLSPRRLDPLTEYIACVVPAFDLGRKAGLGESIASGDEGFLHPAWASGAQALQQVKLPVYFHWEFRTGAGGDFEALVGALEPRDADDMPQVGKRQLDISQPGFPMERPLPEGTTLDLEGALRLVNVPIADWPGDSKTLVQGGLKKILDVPWLAIKQGNLKPIAAPPIYGSWQAGRHTVEIDPVAPAVRTWLDDLNLDPRNRAVAALGTAIIQDQQEQLMASAWEQLGEIERINQMKRLAQLGRTVNAVYHNKQFKRFSEETLLKVVSSAKSRVVVETVNPTSLTTTRTMLSQSISKSALPDRAVSATLRRLTSPLAVISTRFQSAGAPPIAIVTQLNAFTSVVSAFRIGAGLVTLDQVTDAQTVAAATQFKQAVRFGRISAALTTAPKLRDFTIVREGDPPDRTLLSFTFPGATVDNTAAGDFKVAVGAHQNYLAQLFAPPSSSLSGFVPEPMNLQSTKELVLHGLDPKNTIKARVEASLGPEGVETPEDPLEPILDAPDFPQPMYEALRDLSQDLLLPGLEHVPQNTIALLSTNSKFVESFMVGLNAEMNREFLWRNYPTGQQGTFFSQFWDTSAGSELRDIDPINEWNNARLGDNAQAGENLVLLIRGELLRRYPNSVIYAVKAVRQAGQLVLSTLPADEKHPLFRGTMKPDVTFLGFGLSHADVIADPGWFFVIQQQPTEPRFGMDVADFSKPAPPLTTWNNLSWRHLAENAEQLAALSHASVQTELQTVLPNVPQANWGRNSAHQAYITLQRPVRIAIHASELL